MKPTLQNFAVVYISQDIKISEFAGITF